jgi:MSHA biogenesis protein MshJ
VNALWRRTAAKFDALSVRERVMVSAAVMVALLALAYTLMIEPELKKQQRSAAAMLQKQSEVRALDAQVQGLLAARAQDPDRARRERLAQLAGQVKELESSINAEERRFTRPAQMRGVVEGVLGRARGVELVELKTLAVTTLSAKESKDRVIYRHGLELTVAGSYLDLLAYLRALEALPTQLYWGALSIDASKYPRVLMKLTVYTLSLDRAWLNV